MIGWVVLFAVFVTAFSFLLIAKLLVITAWTAQPDVRDEVVAEANRWFSTAKIIVGVTIGVPVLALLLFLFAFK